MSRNPEQRISDILTAVAKCERYLQNLAGDDAEIIEMAEDAIERNLQIIGEATKHLPVEITQMYPEIGWPQIRGFRNILVHQYFGVDRTIIREVIEMYLPPLVEVLQKHQN